MAITYREIKRIIQPLFQRYRTAFRGPRNSHMENLEMGKMLVDLKRLDQNADYLNNKIYSDVQIMIGSIDPQQVPIHVEYEDGKYYTFEDIQVEYYGDSATPDILSVDTVSTLAAKVHRIANKVKELESRKD